MKVRINPVLPAALFLGGFGHHLQAQLPSFSAALASEESLSASSSPQNSSRMFDPNAMPNSHGLWLDGELLFWKSNMGSLRYGITSKSTSLIKDGHLKQPHFEWDWGFRLGLGYKLPHDQWDLFANYTYVRGNAHGHANRSDNVVFPTWAIWGLGSGFGIYGNGSAALLSGHFDVHEKEKLEKADLRLVDIKNVVDNLVATADLALGLQWDYLFSRDRLHFGIKFGWEFNLFFDQNQLFNFLGSGSPGALSFKNDDLTFHGMTLGLRFDF